MKSDRHRADEDIIVTADRERALVRFVPRLLDGFQEGSSLPLAVGHRHVRNESRDIQVLASSNDRGEVIGARLPENEALCSNLHGGSIAGLRDSAYA